MGQFQKRTFKNIGQFFKEITFLFKNRKKIKVLEDGELISAEFRQRLMMAVTEVNGCRYCSYYHSKLALKAGISNEELDSLLSGDLDDSPSKEKLALLYAQHWTENNGKPDSDFEAKLVDQYGFEKAELINLAIRTINFGNLAGNTFDFILYKLSFGLLGKDESSKER